MVSLEVVNTISLSNDMYLYQTIALQDASLW